MFVVFSMNGLSFEVFNSFYRCSLTANTNSTFFVLFLSIFTLDTHQLNLRVCIITTCILNIGNIPLGTSIMALCPQTMTLHKNLTAQTMSKPSFESKGPPIVASNTGNKTDEKCFL